jgi:hypothetical protein
MRQNQRQIVYRTLLAALLLASLAGCSLIDRLQRELYPTATVTSAPTEAPGGTESPPSPTWEPTSAPPTVTLTATVAPPEPTDTARPEPTFTLTPSPSPAVAQHLVYARGGSLYRGDYFGAESVEVAIVPEMEAMDFYQGVLVAAQGRNVNIVNLRQGTLSTFQIPITATVDYAEVHWGASGRGLLYLALVPDPSAETFERSVELRFLSPQDGAEKGRILVPDVAGVSVLHYDDVLGRIMLIPRGPEISFAEIEIYDTRSGQLVGAFPAQGDGEAAVSADARYVLTERLSDQGAQLLLYDLQEGRDARPRAWQHPAGSYSVFHVWSPDGRYVAYLLREGRNFSDESTKGLGLWVLDVAEMQAKKVLEEPDAASSLFGWTPDGAYIIGHHRSSAQDEYWYAVRPDGGDRRLLSLGPQAEVLGWMPSPEANVPKVVMDPWQARFLATVNDPGAMAEVVAQFVASQGKVTDEALSEKVHKYLKDAGWQLDLAGPRIKRLTQEIALAQLPPMAIYVLEAGHAQLVASGDLILDARLEGNDLGLIFGVIGASSIQPAFSLLRRQEDATWLTVWSPQGCRDWITTDGEIKFVGKGLNTLQVSGSSFGLDVGEDEVFSECHACPHRRLVATWSRRGDVYVRQTKLKADASMAEVIWEMTERRPYAILYECLRRVRRGLSANELISDKSVLSQIEGLGLLGKDVHLIPEEERANEVLFSDALSQRRFRATIEGGRVMHIERLAD